MQDAPLCPTSCSNTATQQHSRLCVPCPPRSPAAPGIVALAGAGVHNADLDHAALVVAHAVAVEVLAQLGGHWAVLAANCQAATAAGAQQAVSVNKDCMIPAVLDLEG
jgi:hypothetical protein